MITHVSRKDLTLFFFNDTATTEIYTLSLHDALPISLIERFVICHGRDTWRHTGCRRDHLFKKNIPQPEQKAMATSIVFQNDQYCRLEAKLRRELGEAILTLLAEEDVEDIVLNPDSCLWVKRRGAGFVTVGSIAPATAT